MGVKGRNWRLSIDVLVSTRRERGVERAVEGRASGVNCRWRGERSMQLCAEYDVALFIQTSPAFQEHKLLT